MITESEILEAKAKAQNTRLNFWVTDHMEYLLLRNERAKQIREQHRKDREQKGYGYEWDFEQKNI